MAKKEKKAPTEDEVKQRIKFAKDLYSEARSQMDEDEDLFTGEYTQAKEFEDLEIEIVKPPRPMAILFKFVSRLATRAEMGIQVVPKMLTDQEEQICTTLERWLGGYKFQAEYEAKNPIYRYFVTWALLRGRGCLELRLREQYANTDNLVIEPLVDDPYKISPVYGAKGIMYYAKEYKRYAWDVQQELGQAGALWNYPAKLRQKKPTEEVTIKEYWDKEYHAAFIDDERVYLKVNPLGLIPLHEVRVMDTPLESAKWASQSILHPISDMLKKKAELMSKGITGLELHYWPRVFYRGPDGRSYWIDSDPASVQTLPPEGEFVVVQPVPNQMLLQQLDNMVDSEINLLALPEISWGGEPGTLQSGRAISQVLSQTLDVIEDKRQNLERALGWHFGDVLRLVEMYAKLSKDNKFAVMAEPEEPGRKRRDLVAIGKEEVAGHHRVIVSLSPPLPEDKMVRYEIARRAKELGMDMTTILSDILEMPNPDEVKERAEKEMLDAMCPEIMAYKRLKHLEKFVKEQKDLKNVEELVAMVGPPTLPGEGEIPEEEGGRPTSEALPSEEYSPPEEPGPEERVLLGVPP